MRRNLRIINKPKTRVKTSIGPVPTHHVACIRPNNPTKTAARAAGLKNCLPWNAIMYLDAMASMPARKNVNKWLAVVDGGKIQNRMSADMVDEPELLGIPQMWCMAQFVPIHAASRIASSVSMPVRGSDSCPVAANSMPANATTLKPYKSSRYMVMPFKNWSSLRIGFIGPY